MRPPTSISLAIVYVTVLLAGCGGGDGGQDEGRDTGADTAAPTTIVAPATAAPATTAVMPITSDTECEDVPDPADYPEGQIPRAFRPCTIPTELVVHVIRANGVGRAAAVGDTLIVDYTGIRAETGEMFDSSYLRDVPLDFPLGRGGVVAGWDQGLVGVHAGDVIKLDIPADLAYGDAPPSDAIQPGDALTFVIEVRAVLAPVTAADAPLDLVVEPSQGATELRIDDVVVGDGAAVEAGDTAVLHMLLVRGDNLVVLLDTWERQDPLQVVVAEGQSLPGIIEGIQGGRVGGTRVLTLPPDLAFGPDGEPSLGLPAGVDLIVVAEIVGVY